jgi:U3 small nucleolar RNA-associated protein 4
MTPIIIPYRGFTTENHRTLPLVPPSPSVITLPDNRMLMSFWGREVKIWKVEELSEVMPEDINLESEDQGRKLLSRIILNNDEHITSADITPLPGNAGFLLAVSTIGEVKLFCLRPSKRGSEVLRVQRVAIPTALPLKKRDEADSEDSDDEEEVELADKGARHLKFTPDGKRLLIITPDSRILIANLDITIHSDRKEKPIVTLSSPIYELDRDLPQNKPQPVVRAQQSKKLSRRRQDEGSHGAYLQTIVRFAFSSTSRLLAVGDLAGNITTFSLSDDVWTRIPTSIPRLPAAPVALTFRPAPATLQLAASADDEDEAPDAELLVLPADTQVLHLFSATSGRLTQWSQRNPMPDCLPNEFAGVQDRAVGAFWEGPERVWIHGAAWVWMFDFSRDWPNHGLSFDTVHAAGESGKRKRGMPMGVGSISGAGGRNINPMGLAQQPAPAAEESDSDAFPLSDEESSDEGPVKGMMQRKKKRNQKPYWGSVRYRSLLGFLPVGKREVVEMIGEGWEGGLDAIEVAVVERPVWDIIMPPRFLDGKS